MKLKHLENIDKCCNKMCEEECQKCPLNYDHYEKRSREATIIYFLCNFANRGEHKPIREIIEEIKSIELPPKEKE